MEKKSDYEEYLDKYCESKGLLHEEAMTHAIVREYKRWKEEEDGAKTGIQSPQFQQEV